MTEQDYELLSQYIDGELPASAALELRKRLLAEPPLRAAFEALRGVDDEVRAAFSVLGTDTVPEHVTAMLRDAPTHEETQPRRHRAAWGLAVAASLVAATAVLVVPDWREASSPSQINGDDLLAQMLEHSPSRSEGWDALPDGRQARPLLSFQNQSGQWCREYLLSSVGQTWRGVACRDAGNWRTQAFSVEDFQDHGSEYRPAGAKPADDINAYINSQAADIPLSVDQEADLITSHWK